MLPAATYVSSEDSFSNFITPSNYPDLIPSNIPNNIHVMNMDVLYLVDCIDDTTAGNRIKNMLQRDKVILLHML